MYYYRQVLVRMRQGDSDREIAAGRGWLTPEVPLPANAALAPTFAPREALPASSVSNLEPWRERVTVQRSKSETAVHLEMALKNNDLFVSVRLYHQN